MRELFLLALGEWFFLQGCRVVCAAAFFIVESDSTMVFKWKK